MVLHSFIKFASGVDTGPAVAAFVGKRVTQKAELVHYLEYHKGSVCRVMNSRDCSDPGAAEPQAQQQNQQQQQGGDGIFMYDSSTSTSSIGAYSNGMSISGSIRARSDSCLNSSNGTSYTILSQVSPGRMVSPGMAGPASARRASLTAYLQGKQDLVTTVTTGVPYADETSPCGVYRQSLASQGISPEGSPQYRPSSCCGEPQLQQQGGATVASAPAAAASNDRHTVVKEALSARLSDAGR